jgi:hypothetical protein
MKRSELEKYLGKPVRIKLFNGRIEEGYLHKTGEEKYKYNPNLYLFHGRFRIFNNMQWLYIQMFACGWHRL